MYIHELFYEKILYTNAYLQLTFQSLVKF